MPILAEVIPRGDGTYILKPRPTDSDLNSWVPVTRASTLLGMDRRTIYTLINPESPLLVHRRLLKRKIMISLKSIQTFLQATVHPDFWSDNLQRKKLQNIVRKEMSGLQPGA